MGHTNVPVPVIKGGTPFLLPLLMAVVVTLLLPSHVHAADVPDREFANLRVKWREWLVGTTELSIAYYFEPDVIAAKESLYKAVSSSWASMNKYPLRRSLWSDTADSGNSAHMTTSYKRLKNMALAYSVDGSSLYLNPDLKKDLISALDWMYSNRYNEREKEVDNWWDWEIGTPQLLNDITILMYDELTESQRSNYVNAVNHFVPDPTKRKPNGATEEGANRADKALVCVIAGAIEKSSDTIFKGQEAVSQVFEYVDNGYGFYKDGSFVNHQKVANTGAHGIILLNAATNIVSALGDSRWRITDPNQQNIYRWVRESIIPFIYRGAMMDSVRGRSISRSGSQDHIVGRQVIAGILRLSSVAEPHEAEYLHHVVKRWVTEDTTFANYYAGMDVMDVIRLKEIMRNPSVPIEDELRLSKVYTSMARAVHRQPGYGFAVSMFSPRITAFDYNGGENRKGWYTGMGMTTLYDNDLLQYSEDYWATVDMYRLPGTTTDGAPSDAPVNGRLYTNPKKWVGGASLDNKFSAVGMEFSLEASTGSSLQGRKSWFMFPGMIACVGSGITGGDGRNVETIIENRRLRNGREAVLTVNGRESSSAADWSTRSHAWSTHVKGADGSPGTGYFFPRGTDVDDQQEERTGAWSDVNQGGSTETRTNVFFSLSIPHGVNPKDAGYFYVTLPGRTAAETEAFERNPQVEEYLNEDYHHGVSLFHDTILVICMNFFQPTTSFYYIQARTPLSVITKQDYASGLLHIAVSDPTQSQDYVELEIAEEGFTLVSKDEKVTAQAFHQTVYMKVDTRGAQGATFNAVFKWK